MATDLEKAREKLDKEFAQVKEGIGRIHVAFDAVIAAGPTDDVHALLDELDSVVTDVRTGGVIGSGAKGHRRALEKYRELGGS